MPSATILLIPVIYVSAVIKYSIHSSRTLAPFGAARRYITQRGESNVYSPRCVKEHQYTLLYTEGIKWRNECSGTMRLKVLNWAVRRTYRSGDLSPNYVNPFQPIAEKQYEKTPYNQISNYASGSTVQISSEVSDNASTALPDLSAPFGAPKEPTVEGTFGSEHRVFESILCSFGSRRFK